MSKQQREQLDTYYNRLYAKVNEYNAMLSQLARQTRMDSNEENNAELIRMYSRFVNLNDTIMDTATTINTLFRRMFPNKNLEKQRYSIAGAIGSLPIGRLIEMTHPKLERNQATTGEHDQQQGKITAMEQSGARRIKGKKRQQVKRTIRKRKRELSRSKQRRRKTRSRR